MIGTDTGAMHETSRSRLRSCFTLADSIINAQTKARNKKPQPIGGVHVTGQGSKEQRDFETETVKRRL